MTLAQTNAVNKTIHEIPVRPIARAAAKARQAGSTIQGGEQAQG